MCTVKNMATWIYRIGLGLALALLICLLPLPYGYYTLVRFAAMIVFGCMAFNFYREGKLPLCVLAASLALLFQPIFKVALGRTMWNAVDVLVAVALIVLWYTHRK
mgnify:FL=1